MVPYTNSPPRVNADVPRSPYPLTWTPRIYGTAFGLAGPGGAS